MFSVYNSDSYLELEATRLRGEVVRLQDTVSLVGRKIPGSGDMDLMSVYGYPNLYPEGAMVSGPDLDNLLENFALEGQSENYITAYLRLGVGETLATPSNAARAVLADVGEIVFVKLDRNYADIFAGYRKQLRYELRQAHTFTFEQSSDVKTFFEIYSQNMKRVHAHDDYFFELSYLTSLCSIDGVQLRIACDEKGPVAGAVIISHNNRLFYHLGATTDRALEGSPMKYLLNDIINEYAGGPALEMILGGGLGGKNDSLLRFKRGFSKDTYDVNALRIVLDIHKYSLLTKSAEAKNLHLGYFPAYRKAEEG